MSPVRAAKLSMLRTGLELETIRYHIGPDIVFTRRRRTADRLLELCSVQAGVYIKAGQHLASLRPLIPSEFTTKLSKLHDNAPQSTLADVRYAPSVCIYCALDPLIYIIAFCRVSHAERLIYGPHLPPLVHRIPTLNPLPYCAGGSSKRIWALICSTPSSGLTLSRWDVHLSHR